MYRIIQGIQMKSRWKGCLAWLMASVCVVIAPASAWSQSTYDYSLYVDADANPGSGCNAGPVSGAEIRLRVTASGGVAPQVLQVTRERCTGGTFSGVSTIAGSYPVGADNGIAGSDVIELSDALNEWGVGSSPSLLFSVVATSDAGEDDLLRADGAPGGPLIGLPLQAVTLPMLGIPLLILMVVLLGMAGARVVRRRALWRVVGLLSLLSGVAIAANFVVDGQVGDWSGVSPLATDPAGDATSGESAIDLRAFFAAIENGRVFLRIDVTNLQNNAPTALAGSASTLEDQSITVNLSGTDNENDPLGFVIVSAPGNGSLGAVTQTGPQSATVQYTPDADAYGSDSFTFTVNDGQVTSAAATIALTVMPVNDVPSFTGGGDQAVNEDAGTQAVNAWATAISAGPANESGQLLDFIVGNDNNALFSTPPTISAAGVLNYTPAANANGVANVTVSLHDNGGTANGGVDTSAPQTFTITINSVNDAPSFIKGADQTVLEGAPAQTVNPWASAISAGPADEAGQVVTFNVSNDNNALFSAQPAVSPSGVLTYAVAASANGSAVVTLSLSDDGGTANGGVDTSAAQTFTITVSGINDAPSFNAGPDQSVLEDAGAQTVNSWATAISPGPPNESGQTVSFNVTGNTNAALFSAGPAISPSGVLSYTPAPNANGVAMITLVAVDDGGTANGGVDTSAAQSFTITVTAVNDAPGFIKGADQSVSEDAAAQTIAGWATAISAGPADESGQALSFAANNDNNGLFSVQPAVSPTGTLSFTPAPDANGSATVTLTLSDSGGTANGGVDTSAAQSFVITVTAINDAPSFTAGGEQSVAEDAGAQTVNPWATAISAGPANESGQVVSFNVTGNTNAALFSAGPAISSAGVLTYTPAADASGVATISVVAMDDGGTANGGVNTSAAQTFTITVSAVNDPPVLDLNGPAAGNDFAATYTEGNAPVAIVDAAALTVSDIDSANLASATVTISNLLDGSFEQLAATTGATAITANYVAASGVLTLNGPDTVANFQAVLRTLTYLNSSTAPNETARTIAFVANDGSDDSNVASSLVTVAGVNTIPSFTGGPAVTINEDAGAQSIANWATAINDNDGGLQTLSFNVTPAGGSLAFSATPAISATGTLTFTTAANAAGSATFDVVLVDSGSNNNTSAAQTLTINVNAVNDAPSFSAGGNQTVLEDAGAQTVTGWASSISPGPADEAGQSVTFNITGNTNAGLFSAGPSITPGGALSYTPLADANGSATISVNLTDDGGTANGGVDTSAAQTFTITVTPVNDAPGFLKGADQAADDNVGAQTVNPWATALSTGPADESAQSLTFVIDSNSAPGIFAAGPSISSSGVLTYTPATVPTGTSTATIVVHVMDSGGTANGGVNVSASQSFDIAITHANALPVLTNDPISYATAGNTQLQVAGATIPGLLSISDAQSALAKSVPTDLDGPNTPAVVAASGTSANGGNFSIDASGAFSYVPAAGFSGADSFTYVVTDGNTPTPGTVTGTINIAVGPTVWYINNAIGTNNPAGGDGRSSNAFDTIAAFNAATTGAGDIIFVFNGNSASTPLSGGISLKDGQKLWGEGHGLTIAPFGTLVAAGTQPRIVAASTDAVSVPATAGNRSNIEIRGLDLQGSPNAIDVTAAGANNVGVTISGNTVSGATAEGIDVNFGSSGNQQVAISGNTITASGTGIDVSRSVGTATITAFDDNTISGNTVGTGIVVNGVIFDATPGNPINTVSAGNTVIGSAGNGVGSSGMLLGNVTGDLSFTDLDIVNDAGNGLAVSSSGALNAVSGSGFRIAVAAGVGSIISAGGPAIDINAASASLPLVTVSSANSTTTGISLVNAFGGGTVFSASSGSITDPGGASGTSFRVDGGAGNINYSGAITSNSGGAVHISNRGSDLVTLGGAISDSGSGILLTNNTGAAIRFTGALTLATGGNPAFTATGGGTVTATDATSTASTTTATAVNVANTTIGAAGLNFRSISAGTAASGPGSGIVLNTTGALGGLTVSGTGAAGSGGTIQRTSGDGISLINTRSPSFTSMRIQNTAGDGIGGSGVVNFSFVNGSIDNSGTGLAPETSNIGFNTTSSGTENNLSGVVTITGNTLTNSYYHGIDIFNFNGTISDATISGNTITSATSTATSLGSGLRLIAFGSGAAVANVTRATIANNVVLNFPGGSGIQVQGGNGNVAGPAGNLGIAGSVSDVIAITGNRVSGASPATRMGTQAILAAVNGKGQGNFEISSNGTIANPLGNTLGTTLALSSLGNANVTATISNNVIVANNMFGSQGIGAGTGSTSGTSDTPNLTVSIINNVISQTDGNGILVVARGATGSVRSKIESNTVAAPLGGVRQGIRVDAGNGSSINDGVCLNISGNVSAGNNASGTMSSGIGLRKQGTASATNAFSINGMAATSSPGVESYVGGLNPASTTGNYGTAGTDMISASSGFSGCTLP